MNLKYKANQRELMGIIEDIICKYYGTKKRALHNKCQFRFFLKLKKTFILLCAKYGVRSYKIADYLGYSDTHVMNIIRKNKTYDYEFNDIDNVINQKI